VATCSRRGLRPRYRQTARWPSVLSALLSKEAATAGTIPPQTRRRQRRTGPRIRSVEVICVPAQRRSAACATTRKGLLRIEARSYRPRRSPMTPQQQLHAIDHAAVARDAASRSRPIVDRRVPTRRSRLRIAGAAHGAENSQSTAALACPARPISRPSRRIYRRWRHKIRRDGR